MSFLDKINGVSAKVVEKLANDKEISDEFKGVIDFCINNDDCFDSFIGNGYAGNGYDGNGFEDICGNGFEDFGTNGYEGNGYAEIGGNGEKYLETYNFDEEISNFWQEG